MRRLLLILLIVPLVFQICGQVLSTADSDHEAVLSRMRHGALTYSDQLQDFICTELMTRSKDDSGTEKHWKVLETRELDLGFIAHKEHYRLLKVNGKASNPDQRIKKGYFQPSGEFGSTLLHVFSPKVAAHFEWDHDCTFRYSVPVSTSDFWITADADHVRMAYGGSVTADCATGDVLQLRLKTEPASVKRGSQDIAIGDQIDVRYALTPIGSGKFLLPQEATTIAPFGKTLTKAEIRFRDYRKYDASSAITFDDAVPSPQ